MTMTRVGQTGAPSARAAACPELLPFSPPTAAECAALRRAAAYLRRAGTELGTRSLMPDLAAGPGWAAGRAGPGAAQAGFAALQDSLRAAAALCSGTADMGRRDGGTAEEVAR